MSPMGSTAWANYSNGALSWTDKMAMLQQEAQRQLTIALKRLRRYHHVQLQPTDLDSIVLPDSALARGALRYCESVSPTALLNHTLRTYYWASILARQDQLKVDAELLYVMSLLHDLGLTDAHNQQDTAVKCFAVEGARAAGRWVRENGTPEQAAAVEDSITRHLNLVVPPSVGVEAHVMHAGTQLDVVGARLGELSPEAVRHVLETYPRLGFKQVLVELFNREYSQRPDSRIAFIQQTANLNKMIEQAAFPS